MRLQTHTVAVTNPETVATDGFHAVKLVNGDDVQNLKISNDFSTAIETDPSIVSVGTLIDLLFQVSNKGLEIPAAHATTWRAIISNIRNTKQAHVFSQTQVDIEMAAPGSLDVVFHLKDMVGLTPNEDLLFHIDKANVNLSYLLLANRLQQWTHTLETHDNALHVYLRVSGNTYAQANQLVNALVTPDGCYNVLITNGEKVVYPCVMPKYLVESLEDLERILVKRTNLENYPEVTVVDDTLTIVTKEQFDVLLNGLYSAMDSLEASYADRDASATA